MRAHSAARPPHSFANADEPGIVSGANVHVSFVGHADGSETERMLNGRTAAEISPNVTTGVKVLPGSNPRAIRRADCLALWQASSAGAPRELV